MKARVTVTLKSGILDPQGKAIEGALRVARALPMSRACARARCSTSRWRLAPRRWRRESTARGGRREAAGEYRDRELFCRGDGAEIDMRTGDRRASAVRAVETALGGQRRVLRRARRRLRGGHACFAHPASEIACTRLSSRRHEIRRHRLSRHQSRTRHGAHVAPRLGPRARHGVARGHALPAGTDLVVLPGGFSYGDYLRCGAIAARAPIMDAVRNFADAGGLVLGVCNGFQIFCEAGLLPGVLMRNAGLKFVCRDVHLRVERSDTPFTRGYNAGQVIRVPVAHGEGNFVADAETLARLEGEGRVLFRYTAPDGTLAAAANVNGSTERDRRHRQRARQRARLDAASRRTTSKRRLATPTGAACSPVSSSTSAGPPERSAMTVTDPDVTAELIAQHGLKPDEYDRLLKLMGRAPSFIELGIFSRDVERALLLQILASSSADAADHRSMGDPGAGRERRRDRHRRRARRASSRWKATTIPSFIEPYQGAATGVGGIMRDVFTMGARPIAMMNALSLRRAEPSQDAASGVGRGRRHRRLRQLHAACRRWAARCNFHRPLQRQYPGQRHVRGHWRETDKMFNSAATGAGNPVVYIGSKTGRDGIHGATMASAEFDEDSEREAPDRAGRRSVHRKAAARSLPRN